MAAAVLAAVVFAAVLLAAVIFASSAFAAAAFAAAVLAVAVFAALALVAALVVVALLPVVDFAPGPVAVDVDFAVVRAATVFTAAAFVVPVEAFFVAGRVLRGAAAESSAGAPVLSSG